MGSTTAKPTAHCLDLTRLISRIGRGPMTGIDRVEFAYLKALVSNSLPCFGLVRFVGGYAVLDSAGMGALFARISGNVAWGSVNIRLRFLRKSNPMHRRALSDIRRLALKVIKKNKLSQGIKRYLPHGTSYLNVGHSNISKPVLTAVREISGSKISIMLHDTIPLDFPQFQRPVSVARFEKSLQLSSRYADLLLCPSEQSRQDVLRNLTGIDRKPEMLVAHLGINYVALGDRAIPESIDLTRPYFVALGTIEPRKNHTLLLDVWGRLAETNSTPQLIIIGQRGWLNQAVFDRLDRKPDGVAEFGNLDDGTVSAILQGSCGLLFPSFAEGYGLPAVEAAQMGIPVVCNDLPVFHEILGDYPIYADVSDSYKWETIIQNLAHSSENTNNGGCGSNQTYSVPGWDDHFNLVLRLT